MFKKFFGKKEDLVENEKVNSEIIEKPEKAGFLKKLEMGLKKTKKNISEAIDNIIVKYTKIDEAFFEEIEDTLISADLGVSSVMEITEQLKRKVKLEKIKEPSQIKEELSNIMKEMIREKNFDYKVNIYETPLVILVVGVNGVGKTTTIGKLAFKFKSQNKKVMLAAADTFRAAAIDQLAEWAKRANVDIISHNESSDPAAVVFDAIASAKSKNVDILICDTAGRLHNRKNLMNELNKIYRVISQNYPDARKESLLVVDGTAGQNALFQAKEFKEVADITGVVVTKLDGSAKGGVVFPLQLENNIPVKYIGIGEQIENLVEFDPDEFINAIIK